jgi:hypothetical protein
MKRIQPQEETGRVLALALTIWAVAVGAATLQGVFANLSAATITALAVFASLYAPATYRIDRQLRAYVQALPARNVAIAVLGLDAVLVLALAAHVAWPMLAFFGLPLALAGTFALAERLATTSARRTSPGGRPAAT